MRAFVLGLIFLLALPAVATEGPKTCQVVQASAGEAVYSLTGDIKGGEAATVTELAKWAVRGHASTLVIKIDSPGGSMTEAIALYRAIRGSGLPTRCEVGKNGDADSGAFLALQACDVRVMHKTAHLVTHRAAVIIARPMVLPFEVVKMTRETLESGSSVFDALIAARLGRRLEDYLPHVANGAVWKMDAAEALASHAVDMVATTP